MSEVQRISESFDYSREHDYRTVHEHHLQLVRAMNTTTRERRPRGEHIRWSDSKIVAIRNAYATGLGTLEGIAAMCGCSAEAIRMIVHGESYRDVGGPIMSKRAA